MAKFITITAGHSSTDPGAVNGVWRENAIVTDLRNMISLYLDRLGVVHKEDAAGTNTNLPLRDAIELAKGALVAVDLHCNAGPKTATGVEALCSVKHKANAQRICKVIADLMGTPLRGDKGWKPEGSGQHSRLGYVSSGGGIVLEVFFLSNDRDLAKWQEIKWLVAKAIAQELYEIYKGN